VKEERQGYEKGNQKLLLFIFSSTTRTKFGIHHFEKKVEKKNRIKRKTKANLEVNDTVLANTATAAVTNRDATRVVTTTRAGDADQQWLVRCA
jgi:hypothetical protein